MTSYMHVYGSRVLDLRWRRGGGEVEADTYEYNSVSLSHGSRALATSSFGLRSSGADAARSLSTCLNQAALRRYRQ